MWRRGSGFLTLALIAASWNAAWGGTTWHHRLYAQGYMSARAVAMGGTVTSLRGDFDVALYNPAGLELYRYPQTFRISVCFDPLSVGLAASDWRNHPAWNRLDRSERIAVLGLALKGLLLRWNFLDLLVSLGEDLSAPVEANTNQWWDGWGDYPAAHGHYVAARLRPSKEVAIGSSVFYAQKRGLEGVDRDLAVSYGVLVTSREGMRFGLAYLTFPGAARERMLWEARLPHATLNLGISKTWGTRAVLALDVRNLSDEGKPATREFHVGTEIVPYRHFAVRAGAYRVAETHRTYATFGIGLLDRNRFVSPDRFLRDRSFVIQYGARVQLGQGSERNVAHFLSCLVRM